MNIHQAITENHSTGQVDMETVKTQWKIITGFYPPGIQSLGPRVEFCQAAAIFGYTGDITGKLSSAEVNQAMMVLSKFHDELMKAIQPGANHTKLIKCVQTSLAIRINPVENVQYDAGLGLEEPAF